VRGEKVGVRLAEECSVREAEVGELLIAEGSANLVHVASRVRSVDERKQLGAALLASRGEVLVGLNRDLLFGRVVENRIERVERILARTIEEAHRRASADPAWIEADEVESRVETGQS